MAQASRRGWHVVVALVATTGCAAPASVGDRDRALEPVGHGAPCSVEPATTVTKVSSETSSEVWLVEAPPGHPPLPLDGDEVSPRWPLPIDFLDGDRVVVDAVGCVHTARGWQSYALGPADRPTATLAVGDRPATALHRVLRRPQDVRAGDRVTLGFSHGGFDYDASRDPRPRWCDTAAVSVKVLHADKAVLAQIAHGSPPPGAFDVVALHGADPNGYPEDPLFAGQMRGCAATVAGGHPTGIAACLTEGPAALLAEPATTCDGFALRSVGKLKIATNGDFQNLVMVNLMKGLYGRTHPGDDLTCPHFWFAPSTVGRPGRARWATCDGADASHDNLENCVLCYEYLSLNKCTTLDGARRCDNDLVDDILHVADLAKDAAFLKLPDGVKLLRMMPLLARWFPLLDDRWHFGDFFAGDAPDASSCRTQPYASEISPECAVGHFMASNGSGSPRGFAGHVDFGPATFHGELTFEDHSPPTAQQGGYDDDDFDWRLATAHGEAYAGYAEESQGLHTEHAGLTSFRLFRAARQALARGDDFWTGLVDAVDADNAARRQFEQVGTPPGSTLWADAHILEYLAARLPDTLDGQKKQLVVKPDGAFDEKEVDAPMPGTRVATVIGELGLDCYHGCGVELHPAYAMAMRIAARAGDPPEPVERWAFFARRRGDSGLCGVPTSGVAPRIGDLARDSRLRDKLQLFVGHDGALEASIVAADVVVAAPSGRTEVEPHPVSARFVPGEGAVVTVPLTAGDGEPADWVEGELLLSFGPATATAHAGGPEVVAVTSPRNEASVLDALRRAGITSADKIDGRNDEVIRVPSDVAAHARAILSTEIDAERVRAALGTASWAPAAARARAHHARGVCAPQEGARAEVIPPPPWHVYSATSATEIAMTRFLLASLLAASACAATTASTAPPAAAPAAAPQRSLYDRLGGKDAITAVVDKFVGRVGADARINARFLNADLPHLRAMLVEQICAASGGPCTYTGKDMKTAHQGMNITSDEFDALVGDLQATLDEFKVGAAEQKDLLGALGPMKPDIVGQ